MAEVLVVGKKISEMDLVTDIVGDEKIPTGVVGDKAVTTGQLLTYLENNGKVQWGRIEGDITNQADLQNQFTQQLVTLQNHIQDQGNPHNVTKEQVGLGLVDNTADMDKPVSVAVQESLSLKADQTYVDDSLVNKTHNSLLGRDADGVHPSSSISDASGVTQQEINDLTGAPYRVKAGGYSIGDRVVLENRDIVKSTLDGNTNDPNSDLTGWVKTNDASQILNSDGSSLQQTSDRVQIIEERAIFIEDFNPAYSAATLGTRYSTLTEAQVDYPSAYSLAQSIDTAAIQEAVNAANGRKVLAKEGAIYNLTAINPTPDTHAGNYSILVTNAVEILTNGSARAKFIVPANSHGLVVNTNNFKLDGIDFDSVGTVGTIGHHIKLYDSDNAVIRNAEFKGVSDAAVSLGARLDTIMENFDDLGFDMWSVGCVNPIVENIIVHDCAGDAGLELMGTTGGIFRGNKFFNRTGHQIRCVGNRDALIERNYAENKGDATLTFSAFISVYSGAISPVGKTPRPFYNSNITVRNNEGKNVRDFVHFGIGAEDIKFYDNFGTCMNDIIKILNSGADIGRWGLKNSFIERNTIVGANRVMYIDAGTETPSSSKSLDGVKIRKNYFGWSGATHGVISQRSTATKNIANIELKDNDFVSLDNSMTNENYTIQLVHVNDSDLSGNRTTMQNGLDLTVFSPTNVIYGKRQRIGVVRSSSSLLLRSRNDLKNGMRITLETTDTLPAGLSLNTVYYIYVVSATQIRVNTDLAAAMAGTGLAITDDGSGNHFMNFI